MRILACLAVCLVLTSPVTADDRITLTELDMPDAVFNTNFGEELVLHGDLANVPTPNGLISIQAGETWNFQMWFRDANPSPTSNFTDAVSVTFP